MKKIASFALIAIVALAGCSGRAAHSPPVDPLSAHGAGRAPQSSGGPGTTTLTYLSSYAPYSGCSGSGLVISVGGSYPAPTPPSTLNFPAGQGPQLYVASCNFTTPQYVRVTLGTPTYGTPYIRQSGSGPTVNIDAPAAAQVTATWTALGPTLPGTPGLTGTVSFTIGDDANSNIVWKTQGYQRRFPDSTVGQCENPTINNNNATFAVHRNTSGTYVWPPNTPPKSGASTCYRDQLNPIDSNTGQELIFTNGQQYRLTFQTVVTLNGNYVDYNLQSGGLAYDLPAIVWQAHSYGQSGACTSLVLDNTWKANYNNPNLYPNPPSGGQPVWNFHTCDTNSYTSPGAYYSPDILTDGQTDLWEIDFTPQVQGQTGGPVVVQRNGVTVYNNQSDHICDSSTPNCWWNFGPYAFYYPTTEEPSGWNGNGITVQVNDMTLTTPNGGGTLSRKRGVMGSKRKPTRN